MICYHCSDEIKEEDLVVKPIPLVCKNGKTKNYKRKFHLSCVSEFLKDRKDIKFEDKEKDEWDQLYTYVKTNIFNRKTPLTKHEVARLQGLYVGQYMRNATNIRGMKKRGYSYNLILVAFKIKRNEIIQRIKSTSFKDGDHRMNHIMKVCIEPIMPKLKEKLDQAEKQKERVKNMAISDAGNSSIDNWKSKVKSKQEEKTVNIFDL